MEFIEAPAFTRYISDYLGDDDYRKLQSQLATNPDSGDLIPGTEVSESCAGPTQGAARAAEAVYGSSITTSCLINRFG